MGKVALYVWAAVLATAVVAVWLPGCSNRLIVKPAPETPGTLTDERDGRKYRTAQIGGKTWMAENLNYLPASGNSWCYGDNDANCAKYGRLYDWKTALAACPAGWHLPAPWEWNILGRAAGSEKRIDDRSHVDYLGAGERLKAKSGWLDAADKSGGGTDDYGFSALPGGYRNFPTGGFFNAGSDGYWWTDMGYNIYHMDDDTPAGIRYMYYGNGYLSQYLELTGAGLSVRCARDENKYAATVVSAGADAKGGGRYAPGEPVTIAAGTAPGKRFSHWTHTGGNATLDDTNGAETAFAMPASDITLTAIFDTIIAESGTFTDVRDGKTYRTAIIGGKTWMAENLNFQANNSMCYNCDDSICEKYGKLYDWQTANAVCPAGWHLPNLREWNYLTETTSGRKIASYIWEIAGDKLKAKSGWTGDDCRDECSDKGGNGTDDYSFSALPGGGFDDEDGFYRGGNSGYWWAATDNDSANAARIKYNHGQSAVPVIKISGHIRAFGYRLRELGFGGSAGYSVRCVMDGSVAAEEKWEKENVRRKAEKGRGI
ncbi:MAG: hypothetical protein LBB74_07645 [Chitinispirillales bacterium]|jgi:uncharacterized protein (TIGR02145 family)|nr:hypothetical protein [Chitinispirillales bacterium]